MNLQNNIAKFNVDAKVDRKADFWFVIIVGRNSEDIIVK